MDAARKDAKSKPANADAKTIIAAQYAWMHKARIINAKRTLLTRKSYSTIRKQNRELEELEVRQERRDSLGRVLLEKRCT